MLTIKHILFPVDFSERTCGAAPFVDALAKHFQARVTLMSVAPPLRYVGTEAPMPPFDFDDEDIKADLQSRLDGALVKELASIPVQRTAELGEPAEVITRFAHAEGVDLIMMPTHGYGPFRRLLLGSVTAKVLHDAHCPVWTGAHMEERPSLEHLACRTVLCAVDGTPKSTLVIEWASQFAADFKAMLRLVHVIPSFAGWPERQLDREFEEALRTKAQGDIEKMARLIGIDAPLRVAIGDVAGAVRDEADRHTADMIVIGRGLLHEVFGRLRTHAYGIIREAPCPVISV